MVEYKCLRCGYINIRRGRFILHLKRKFMCPAKLQDISSLDVYNIYFENKDKEMLQNDSKMLQNDSKMLQNDSKMPQNDSKMLQNDSILNPICEYCNRSFTRHNNLKRHYGRCKVKKKRDLKDAKDEDFQDKMQMILVEMEKAGQIVKLDSQLVKPGSIQVDNSQNNNGTINHFNITINPYDKTDWSYITKENILTSIEKGNFGIPYMIKLLHCNKDKPENHNVCIKNIKSNYISVYNENQWDYQLQYEQISMMAEEVINYIEDQISEWDDKFYEKNKEKVKKFNFFQNKYYDPKKTYVYNRVHEELKLGLFNNRGLVLGTHDKLIKLNSI